MQVRTPDSCPRVGEQNSVVVAYFRNFDTLSYLRTRFDDATERNFPVAVLFLGLRRTLADRSGHLAQSFMNSEMSTWTFLRR